MKKIKIIVGAIMRTAFIIAPGVAFGWWFWDAVPAIIDLLAAVGLEAFWLLLFSFISVFVQTWKERKNPKQEEEADE